MRSTERKNSRGFLSRLLQDEAGNAIAIMAASVVPVIGLIGGGVDVSRVYMVKNRLQAACDAGSLMGRRVLGNRDWATGGTEAQARANQMFLANFGEGSYGAENLTKEFTSPGNGAVNGRANASVPMTLLRVFNIPEWDVEVTCNAELRLPATDIMFVLDTTGSMNCPADDVGCTNNGGVEATNSKIKGLRAAVYCFYEAITKKNITTVDKEVCGETADPSNPNSDVRIRMGFVPYAVNVNVGRLLPLDYIADEWDYQSRQPRYSGTGTGMVFSYGREGTPSTQTTTSPLPDGDWVDRYTTNLAPVAGGFWYGQFSANSAADCSIAMPNPIPSTINGTRTLVSQTPNPPVYPTDNSVTRIYERTDISLTFRYRYQFVVVGSNKYCRMQRQAYNRTSNTQTDTVIVPVIWRDNRTFDGWRYKKDVRHDVSGLKDAGNNSWNDSVSLPLGPSGEAKTIRWNGCIEERKTVRVTDADPSNDWDPIPEAALDMDITTPPDPNNRDTQWGPMLGEAIYTRWSWNGYVWNWNNDPFDTDASDQNGSGRGWGTKTEYCPSESRLYDEIEPTELYNYVNGLSTGGNTYHDIGLIWGARLMAPTGIFKALTNDTTASVERHMIFMTDGDTTAFESDYSAYGVHWWDRRQNDGTSAPTADWIKSNIDARAQAVCKWVKNQNITLWVISYGNGVNPATETALQTCATSTRYIKATSPSALVTEFKKIAGQISALRLTE